MTVDLKRLRALSEEPERMAISGASMTDQVLRMRSELEAVRAGLREAIVEIERLYAAGRGELE